MLAQDQATQHGVGNAGRGDQCGTGAQGSCRSNAIAPEILRLASRTHSEARELRESVV